MLTMRPFSLVRPKSSADLKEYLADADDATKIMAGGTDLLPNLKHGLYDLKTIIALGHIEELHDLLITPSRLTLKALVRLKEVAQNKELLARMPALAYAASQIASPQIRAMGTVGGNICLDTRCSYINRTEFWRKALGYCLKKDGTLCHVVKTGKRCVAASSNDLATVLLAYDAELTILSPSGDRLIRLEDLYTANGEKNNVLCSKEIVSSVSVALNDQRYGGFAKLRHRQSFDFPLLSIAVAFELDKEGRFIFGRLVVNALVAKPKVFDLSSFAGPLYNKALVDQIAFFAREKCHPQSNMAEDTSWRKELVEPFTKRAFFNARPFRD